MADGASEPTTDDRDSPWKEALDQYLEPALRLLFPSVHAQIDWSRGWQSLDGELQKVVRDAEVGRRLADKLFRVFLRGGGEVWVALHLEVQGEVDQGLGSRVHVYNYRIADRYDVPVASLVVLADDRPTGDRRPSRPRSSAADDASSSPRSSSSTSSRGAPSSWPIRTPSPWSSWLT